MGADGKPAPLGPKPRPNAINFLNGGLAGMMGAAVVHPCEVLKNRMQMAGQGQKTKQFNNTGQLIALIFRTEGITGFYRGLSAALLRQATYTTARMGVFNSLVEVMTVDGKQPNFGTKAGLGIIAGCCGAFVGNPADLSLVRMSSDGRLPPDKRRNYKNVIDAIIRVAREEGITALWRGAVPTMVRAMVVNAAQLATYSQAKQYLLQQGIFGNNIYCHSAASLCSGFFTTVASLPVDIIKTRYQNMKVINGKPEYRSIVHVFTSVLTKEGPFAFWKGFTAYFARLGPHTIFMFIFLEQLNALYDRMQANK